MIRTGEKEQLSKRTKQDGKKMNLEYDEIVIAKLNNCCSKTYTKKWRKTMSTAGEKGVNEQVNKARKEEKGGNWVWQECISKPNKL